MAATTPSTSLVPVQPAFTDAERLALAGFLAGYLAEGKTHREALRSLKRQVSDAVFTACEPAPSALRPRSGTREGNRGTTLQPARPDHTPATGSSGKPLPGLATSQRPMTMPLPLDTKRHSICMSVCVFSGPRLNGA